MGPVVTRPRGRTRRAGRPEPGCWMMGRVEPRPPRRGGRSSGQRRQRSSRNQLSPIQVGATAQRGWSGRRERPRRGRWRAQNPNNSSCRRPRAGAARGKAPGGGARGAPSRRRGPLMSRGRFTTFATPSMSRCARPTRSLRCARTACSPRFGGRSQPRIEPRSVSSISRFNSTTSTSSSRPTALASSRGDSGVSPSVARWRSIERCDDAVACGATATTRGRSRRRPRSAGAWPTSCSTSGNTFVRRPGSILAARPGRSTDGSSCRRKPRATVRWRARGPGSPRSAGAGPVAPSPSTT